MIIIVGAGLSGLLTAFRLKKAKIPFKVLEAKDRIGGRIFTKVTEQGTPIEMGATWFGRPHQNLIKLLNELEVSAFPQFQGDYYFYDDKNSPHHGKYKLPQQEANYRITGGSNALIERLSETLEKGEIQFNTRVTEIIQEKGGLIVRTETDEKYLATEVILALPPKIWAHQITFFPALPEELQYTAENTQTWMEDSIKAAVEFKHPFWRDKEHPATIMSNSGPFVECYDHSNQQENKFALCGFLNPEFKNIGKNQREALVLKQLESILGQEVYTVISYHEYIWSNDENVKWPKKSFMQPHQNNGHQIFRECFYDNRLVISGSESASTFPGYMDGAVEAGENAFKHILKTFEKNSNQQIN
jgi:monoamine oxidase